MGYVDVVLGLKSDGEYEVDGNEKQVLMSILPGRLS
jgi:hypothetical protein